MRLLGFEIVRWDRKKHQTRYVEFTYMQVAKFLYFKRIFDQVKHLNGDVVECGVGPGHSLLMWAILLKDEMKRRKLWGFDSFEGFPEPSVYDRSERKVQRGEWKATVGEVMETLRHAQVDVDFTVSQLTLVKGWFQESLPKYRGNPIVLLHLDIDLYKSYRVALENLYPKVVPGGAILFDEYMGSRENVEWPGAQKAIDEYLGEKEVFIQRDPVTGKYYLIKPADAPAPRFETLSRQVHPLRDVV